MQGERDALRIFERSVGGVGCCGGWGRCVQIAESLEVRDSLWREGCVYADKGGRGRVWTQRGEAKGLAFFCF